MDSLSNETENSSKSINDDASVMIGDDTDALPPRGSSGIIPNGENAETAMDAGQNSQSGTYASQQDNGQEDRKSASPLVTGTSLLCLIGCIFSLLAFFSVDIFGWEPPLSSIGRGSILLNVIFIPLSWILFVLNRKTEQRKKLLVFALSVTGLCGVWIGIVLFFIILGVLASM